MKADKAFPVRKKAQETRWSFRPADISAGQAQFLRCL